MFGLILGSKNFRKIQPGDHYPAMVIKYRDFSPYILASVE